MIKVAAVKFKSGGKLYYFQPKEGDIYTRNMPVIVETSRGIEYAWIAYPERTIDESELEVPLKPILRIATEKDTSFYNECQDKKPNAIKECKEKILLLNLDMKLIDCEYSFDNSKLTFYFTSPSRVDFRELVKELASIFHTRIELKQVGSRDETKYIGGIAPCGRVCCCHGNMPELKKVTIRMAKTQGLSLNPTKISGLCGRLMCCLSYESDYYAEAYKKVPKIGLEVNTPAGKGNVVSVNMLKMLVKVKIDDGQGGLFYKDFSISDISFHNNDKHLDIDQEIDITDPDLSELS